jgi:nucleotide-binding universal stress UspA family protein
MKKTTRYIVPIDGSRTALRALQHAIHNARGAAGMVYLINVEPALDSYGMVPTYLSPRKHREATRSRAESVLAPAITMLKRSRVPHESHVSWGEPADAIVRLARRVKGDSIVMGTRGMGAAGNLLLGSTATKVVHLAKAPVTLVK